MGRPLPSARVKGPNRPILGSAPTLVPGVSATSRFRVTSSLASNDTIFLLVFSHDLLTNGQNSGNKCGTFSPGGRASTSPRRAVTSRSPRVAEVTWALAHPSLTWASRTRTVADLRPRSCTPRRVRPRSPLAHLDLAHPLLTHQLRGPSLTPRFDIARNTLLSGQ